MSNESEGQALYDIVRGRAYTSEIKNQIIQRGLKRIGGLQWLSLSTGTKYEFLLNQVGEEQFVSRIDIIEKERRIHLADLGAINDEQDGECNKNAALESVHHKTVGAFNRQVAISKTIYETLNKWNEEMGNNTILGQQLMETLKVDQISWEDMTFLPDPLATGKYIFGVRRGGKVAAMRSWLDLPGGEFIMPAEMNEDGIMESLRTGLDFHSFEVENFDTPASAVKFAVHVLNASNTVYAQTIKKMIGKLDVHITRNDFYRNAHGVHCRVEVHELTTGVVIDEIPIVPTLADALDSLLAPIIRKRALEPNGQ